MLAVLFAKLHAMMRWPGKMVTPLGGSACPAASLARGCKLAPPASQSKTPAAPFSTTAKNRPSLLKWSGPAISTSPRFAATHQINSILISQTKKYVIETY